jgi:hypothetical protein
MKKILLSLLLLPSFAWAGPEAIENDLISNPKTGTYVLGRQNEAQTSISATAGDAIAPSYDRFGNAMCSLNAGTASASNPVKLEDSVHTSGDALVGIAAVRNASGTSFAGTEGDYSAIAVNQFGSVIAGPSLTNMGSGDVAAGILKAEDSVHATGDALVGIAGINNTVSLTSFNNTSGDYTPLGLGQVGNIMASLYYDAALGSPFSPIIQEDRASLASDVGVSVLSIREDALTVSTGASADYQQLKSDAAGRLITTLAPAGESWQGCSSAATTTADTAIKIGVASNRIYTTSLSCANVSAVASRIQFKDGASVIYTGSVGTLATTGGSWNQTFPVPLRGSVNTNLAFAMITTATDTVCCASGYISVN